MTVPDEAVEAAAKALWDVDRECTAKAYEDCRDGTKRHLRREARAALEAAEPHLFGRAYNAGHLDGMNGAPNSNPYAKGSAK